MQKTDSTKNQPFIAFLAAKNGRHCQTTVRQVLREPGSFDETRILGAGQAKRQAPFANSFTI
jgi:hypothetical protein